MRLLFGLAVALAALFLVVIAARLAWVGDDAWITLRTVEHIATGDGPRWNPDERVQTFTHPAWLALLSAARALTGEPFLGTIGLSLLLFAAAVVMLLRATAGPAAALALAVVLASARVVGDFATSGLETPLALLLLVLLARAAGDTGEPARRWRRLVLLAPALALTRLDLLLLVAPPLLAAARGLGWRRAAVGLVVAAAPLLAWLAFATFYYGHPLPVSAHAKLFGTGVPLGARLVQGAYYVGATALDDPVLLATLLAGFVVAARGAYDRWLAAGAGLYVGYVVAIGGDFMAGRFLLPPLAVLLPSLAGWLGRGEWWRAPLVFCAAALLGLLPGWPPWAHAPADEQQAALARIAARRGICDERRCYSGSLGLFAPARRLPRFGASPFRAPPPPRARPWPQVIGTAGQAGFAAGRDGHVIDPVLCDALLARLPAIEPENWRPGHVRRRLPEGLLEAVVHGDERHLHPGLRTYRAALTLVARAPLVEPARLAALGRLLAGEHDASLRAFVAEEYFTPPRRPLALAELPTDAADGALWFDEPRLRFCYDGGLAVRLAAPARARALHVQLAGAYGLRVRFVRAGKVLGGTTTAASAPFDAHDPWRSLSELRTESAPVPRGVGEFDELWLDAATPGRWITTWPVAVGALRLGA